ncbi:DUF2909 domain-containing protein [Catenovulum sp. 2E275]|uniref:DUF2909 domain-containing protein n=1 Tax=Catenovulum sp. 2E275 TaxID=2980497 RepID=UPI0021D1AB96|nr:DUF2909 domain-containing protein [Catenovulum sp. 2E275]MCU4674432.1 DUF2909 domain-containing protein [Catenovulum sp. 2E275]
MIKLIIVILLFIVIFNLFKALLAMTKNDQSKQMTKSLGLRLMFSVFTLVFILLMVGLGFITPNPSPY